MTSYAPARVAQAIPIPAVNHTALTNGLAVWHLPSHSLPLVHLRLVVRVGSSLDRDHPGLARLTALAMAHGSATPTTGPGPRVAQTQLPHVEVFSSPGSTIFSLDLPKDQIEEGVDHLGAIARQPHLESAQLPELRASELQRVNALVRNDPVWLARALASQDILGILPAPSAPELSKITVSDIKAFHKAGFGPKLSGLLVVGDVTFDEAVQAAKRALGSWEGTATSPPPIVPTTPIQYTRVILADRPSSPESIVVLSTPGPAPSDSNWTSLWLARELGSISPEDPAPKSCPPSTGASLLSLDTGPGSALLGVCVAAPSNRTVDRASQALRQMAQLSSDAPSAAELDHARAAFNETLSTRLSTLPAWADLLAAAMGTGLEHDHLSRLNAQVQTTTPDQIRDALRTRARHGMLVVVVGDATRLGEDLSRLGDVTVVDPADGFARKRHIPASPAATAPKP